MSRLQKILLGVAIMGVVAHQVFISERRGIRLSNPLNIENNGIAWKGLAASQPDERFYNFKSPEWSFRAAYRIMQTYKNKYGLNTIAGIVTRWAPPHENQTRDYIANVSGWSGIGADEVINTNEEYARIIGAMTRMENGVNPYNTYFILQATRID